MIACGVLSLACGVVLFVGRHPRHALHVTVPALPPTLPAPAAAPELADTWPSLPPRSAHAPVQPPHEGDDDDEAPTQRRTPRKAGFVQVHSEPWSWVDVAGQHVDSHQQLVLPPGEYTLQVVCGGCATPRAVARPVVVHADQTEVVKVEWDDVHDHGDDDE